MNNQPGDYFNNGSIEMARFGTNTFLKNNMTESQHKRLKKKLQRKYPRIKKRINRCVSSLRKQVGKCDPVELLSFASDMFLMSNFGIASEIESSSEDIFVSRMTEYIQSISPQKKIPVFAFSEFESSS